MLLSLGFCCVIQELPEARLIRVLPSNSLNMLRSSENSCINNTVDVVTETTDCKNSATL